MPSKDLTQLAEYKALAEHQREMADVLMRDAFAADGKRFEKFHVRMDGLLCDYSKNRVSEKTMKLLGALARAAGVEEAREKMFAGAAVNTSENRAALHVALRGSVAADVTVAGENVQKFVQASLEKMRVFCEEVRKDKTVTDVVSLGIGGSSLGAMLASEALESFADGPAVHFVESPDARAFAALLKGLEPASTLFVIVSKSFSTAETLINAQAAKEWAGERGRFAAVTENIRAAQDFGITAEHVFPMRPWIGGRTSVWSAAGLSLAIAIGFDKFSEFLRGARAMDEHFRSAPIERNIPAILALLGVWYRNFFDFRALAVIPYVQSLRSLPLWLQQLDMESSGKSVRSDGKPAGYKTGLVVFGAPGTNAQHAFFQSLHQGTDIIPCDFILDGQAGAFLNGNALAQAKGLMQGQENAAEPHRHYPGNRPSNTVALDKVDPYHLGLLMALYEHKVFTQGVLWNINSFDQWGVELGKNLADEIVQAIEKQTENPDFDSSTRGLARYLNALK